MTGVLLCSLSLAVVPGAAVHPFHITMAEAEFNEETGKLEVSLRIYHPTDLEESLSRRQGKRVSLDGTTGVDEMLLAYLEEQLTIERPDGQRAKLEWVGKEVSLKTAWLYFEVDLPGGLEGASFRNRVLFDIERDQVNTVVFRQGDKRATLRFTRAEDRRVFAWPAEEPSEQPAGPEAGNPGPTCLEGGIRAD